MNYTKNKVLSFLKKQKMAVISTIDKTGKSPESALIAFTEDNDMNIYFQTGKNTRKAANLKKNPYISFVIGLSVPDMITMQYEGIAERLTGKNDIQTCKQRFTDKESPTTEEYLNHPSIIFFKVKPTWIGYSDYSDDHPSILELKDF